MGVLTVDNVRKRIQFCFSMNGDVFKELLLGYAAGELEKILGTEKDEKKALRQALLFTIFLCQDDASPAGKRFIEFMLTHFPSLLKGLQHHRFPFLLDTDFKVVIDDRDITMVVIHESFLEKAGKAMEQMPPDIPILPETFFQQVSIRYPFSEWNAVGRRYIGLFDHMGFKNTVNAHKGNYERLHDILKDVQQHILKTEKISARQGKKDKYKSNISLNEEPSGLLKCFQFSDTIMIATKDDSMESHSALLLGSMILFTRMLQDGLLLRGAVACGDAVVDIENNIVFGQPIIDAYLLEESQQWYGIAFHSSTEQEPIPGLPEATSEYIPFTIPYRVPLKDEEDPDKTVRKNLSALNWPAFFVNWSIGQVRQLLAPFAYAENPKLNKYYKHTVAFIERSFRREGSPGNFPRHTGKRTGQNQNQPG